MQDVRTQCSYREYARTHSDCMTSAVVAVMETPIDLHPFLFRSYNNRDPCRKDGLTVPVRNPGKAYNARIWKVARATTAAPGFFSAMQLDGKMFV